MCGKCTDLVGAQCQILLFLTRFVTYLRDNIVPTFFKTRGCLKKYRSCVKRFWGPSSTHRLIFLQLDKKFSN